MAQTQLYTRKAQVFVIEETTQDQYLVQTAASGFLAEIPDAPYTINSENHVPMSVRGNFLNFDETPGAAYATATFRVPMKGSGVDATAPEYNEALKACGFTEDVAAGSSTYKPLSTFAGAAGDPGMSYSVTILEAGASYRMKGCFGNVVFNCQVGEPGFMEFTFMGGLPEATPFVDAAFETITYDVTVPPAFMGATFAQNFGGAVTPKGVTNFTLDAGNVLTIVKDVNADHGYGYARITGRKPTGTFDPEYVLEATANTGYRTLWAAGTTGTLTTGTIGGTAENIWQLDVARCQLRPPEFYSESGIRKVRCPFGVTSATTDVEETNPEITYTLT